jgi:hypothetical protein
MDAKFKKPFWEEIKIDEIKEGNILYIWYDGMGSYDHYRIINGKWFNIFLDKFEDYFKPDDRVPHKLYKQNYKFVSKAEEWFMEGTEAFLESDPWGNDKEGYCACFRGMYRDEKTGAVGEDGEICPFEEFEIEEL